MDDGIFLGVVFPGGFLGVVLFLGLAYNGFVKYKSRRLVVVLVGLVFAGVFVGLNPESYEEIFTKIENDGAEFEAEEGSDEVPETDSSASEIAAKTGVEGEKLAVEVLEELEVKGRASKTGYSREEFYSGWPTVEGCSLRQRILKREFGDSAVLEGCNVVAGEFDEPYTGEHQVFTSREEVSKVQIDHVVALSDAWQKGAQYMEKEVRYQIATDPLNLLAVDGPANMQKSDGDAATWLPSNKKFRCQYVARQVSVKYKYSLWVTEAEKAAISRVLETCPEERAVGV